MKTLEEWKTEYVTKERIDEMMTQRNITEEEAIEILNQTVEDFYSICNVQPMTAPTGEIFKLKRPSTLQKYQ
jgi:hypothetical protein